MIKDYTQYPPDKIARCLKTELFGIEIDRLAAMQLRKDLSYAPDMMNREMEISGLEKKERVMATVYGLVELYENGNTIRMLKGEDVINLYNLIYTHFTNIDNYNSNSIHNTKIDVEGLTILAQLSTSIMKHNHMTLNENEKNILEEKMRMVQPIAILDYSKVMRMFDYLDEPSGKTTRNNGLGHNDVALQKAKAELLY